MFKTALVLFALFLLFSMSFGVVIVFHLLTLGVQGDQSRKLAALFVVVGAILLLSASVVFFSIPWDALPQVIRQRVP